MPYAVTGRLFGLLGAGRAVAGLASARVGVALAKPPAMPRLA